MAKQGTRADSWVVALDMLTCAMVALSAREGARSPGASTLQVTVTPLSVAGGADNTSTITRMGLGSAAIAMSAMLPILLLRPKSVGDGQWSQEVSRERSQDRACGKDSTDRRRARDQEPAWGGAVV